METTLEHTLAEEYRKHPRILRRLAWGDFVARYPWQWFVTLTFTDDVHQERAFKLYRVWISKLNRHLFGPRWHKREPFGVFWVMAYELTKGGRIHLHALLSGVAETRRLDWMDNWSALDEIAGYPRIWPVANQVAVSMYVTKYVTKGGEIEFSRNLRDVSRDLVALASGSGNSPTPAR